MNISDKKRQELYKAFSEPITKLRIEINRKDDIRVFEVDEKLFKLEQKIWREISAVLGTKKP